MNERYTFEYLDQKLKELEQVKYELKHTKEALKQLEKQLNVEGSVNLEVKRGEEALRESEEKFRLAFHTSPDSINLNRLEDGCYIDINAGFTKIMGYTREDAIGKTSLELSIWKNPEDRSRLVDCLKKNGYVENMEAQFVAKDGSIRDGLMSSS
ncbi:MAG: PAS domain S-box protein, partial [Desulfamplus sp.]|nr:PAS domain S-box protein [Desulfamplus sp.]